MSRLVDQIVNGRLTPAESYLVNRFAKGQRVDVPFDRDVAQRRFDVYRNRIRQCPVVAVDDIVALLFSAPRTDMQVRIERDLGSIASPWPSFFLETKCPAVDSTTLPNVRRQLGSLPRSWGYFVEPVPPEDWDRLQEEKQTNYPSCFDVVAWHLFCLAGDDVVAGPVATHFLFTGSDGLIDAPDSPTTYLEGVPDRFRPPDAYVQDFLRDLFLPLLLSWTLSNAPGSKLIEVEPPPAVNRKRARNGKTQLLPYLQLNASEAVRLLRNQGGLLIGGVAGAFRACRSQLIPQFTKDTPVSIVWQPGMD
jgi:hypothetical protein